MSETWIDRRLKSGHCARTTAMQLIADDRNVESQVSTARGWSRQSPDGINARCRPAVDSRERQLCGTSNTTVAEIGKAAYYSSRNTQIDFEVRKRDERKQSPVLVSDKTLWLGLGATDHLAGMGVLYLVAFHIHL